MKKNYAVLLFLLLLSRTAISAELHGRVTDQLGAVISGARILVHWDPAGSQVGLTDNVGIKEDASTVTDSTGQFSLPLPPGFYDVFVSSMAFDPKCTKVRVTTKTPANIRLALKASAVVSKELGHRIMASP